MGQEACGEEGAAANHVLRLKDICVTMEVTSMKKSTTVDAVPEYITGAKLIPAE